MSLSFAPLLVGYPANGIIIRALFVGINRRRVHGWSPWHSVQGRDLLPQQLWILRRYTASSVVGLSPCHRTPWPLETALHLCADCAHPTRRGHASHIPEQVTVAARGMVATTSPDMRRAANLVSNLWGAFAPPPSEPPASSRTVRTSFHHTLRRMRSCMIHFLERVV